MPDILIHHCTLRIVRREGWSWGPDPSALVREAVGALRTLIERALAGMWSDDVDGEITAPVVLHLPVTISELLDVARDDGFPGASRPCMSDFARPRMMRWRGCGLRRWPLEPNDHRLHTSAGGTPM